MDENNEEESKISNGNKTLSDISFDREHFNTHGIMYSLNYLDLIQKIKNDMSAAAETAAERDEIEKNLPLFPEICNFVKELLSIEIQKRNITFEGQKDFEEGISWLSTDRNKAIDFFEKSTAVGNPKARHWLALCWLGLAGYGAVKTPHKEKLALQYIFKSAEQGYELSKLSLGSFYMEGVIVKQDTSEAMKWWIESAEDNNAGAQFNLGYLYMNGQQVQRNLIEAYVWFAAAISGKIKPEHRAMKDKETETTAVTLFVLLNLQLMTRDEITQAQEKLKSLFKKMNQSKI